MGEILTAKAVSAGQRLVRPVILARERLRDGVDPQLGCAVHVISVPPVRRRWRAISQSAARVAGIVTARKITAAPT